MQKPLIICFGLAIVCSIACAQETTVTHSGLYAAKIINTTGAWAGGMDTGLDRDSGGTNDHAAVAPNTTYTLSFWMRNDRSQASVIARVSIACFSSSSWISDTDYLHGTSVPGGTTWTFKTFDWVSPANAANINVGFRMEYGANHQLVVDDVSFVEKANPTIELLANGGFESWMGTEPDHWRAFGANGATYQLVKIVGPTPASADPEWRLLE